MSSPEPFEFTNVADLSVGAVRAPACPVGGRPTWGQMIVAFASVLLFAALFVGALTRDPISIVGVVLSLVGFGVFVWVFAGVLEARWTRGT